ncbi:MAG: tRNA uridine-5-carboxymethylaminomethyl(34) synthesis GTPase MnmE [Proteobacteria bacterium]|nr:tRNA uridine-5-carboxymethylaminomethyl(34) synthesis GTPase MnmE [Pseudomonadota bacterium]
MMQNDTIAAISTPAGRAGIGIIRISGQLAAQIAKTILGQLPKPRVAVYLPFKDRNQETLDQGVAIFFPGPHSFTGEDVLELQGHGGPVILDCVLQQVLLAGARLSNPGEFTERAFLNGKIDLAQAEAIADLIDASSEQAARSALRSLQGDFSKKVKEIVEQLIQLRLYIEAAIDFPTEEIDFIHESTIEKDLAKLIYAVQSLRYTAQQGALLKEGLNVVIAGKPNAGKSSLINFLSGRETAIVTDIPGTTRDILREHINLDGIPLHIIDTAGLREQPENIVEQEGIRRTQTALQQADVILWMIDASQTEEKLPELNSQTPALFVLNKIDLINQIPSVFSNEHKTYIRVSVKNHQGLELLKDQIKKLVGFQDLAEGTFIARRRHLVAIDKAFFHLQEGFKQLTYHQSGELLAEDLRQAQQALNEITGDFTSDDLLGRIFSNFCIGK